jgi:alkaline phosphatase
MKRLFACMAVAAVPFAFGGAAVSAYPPGAAVLTLSPSTVAPGESFSATLTGCALGEVLEVSLVSDSDTATCSGPAGAHRGIMQQAGGSASVTLTAPTEPGTYTVTATTPTVSATATLTVASSAPAPAPGTPLPVTGSDPAPVVQWAVGLVLAGLGLAGVAYHRHRSAPAS